MPPKRRRGSSNTKLSKRLKKTPVKTGPEGNHAAYLLAHEVEVLHQDWTDFQKDRKIRLLIALSETLCPAGLHIKNLIALIGEYDQFQPLVLIASGVLYFSNFSSAPERRFELLAFGLPICPKIQSDLRLEVAPGPGIVSVAFELNEYARHELSNTRRMGWTDIQARRPWIGLTSNVNDIKDDGDSVKRLPIRLHPEHMTMSVNPRSGIVVCEGEFKGRYGAENEVYSIIQSNLHLVHCPQLVELYEEVRCLRTNGTLSYMSTFAGNPLQWLNEWETKFSESEPVDMFITAQSMQWISGFLQKKYDELKIVNTITTAEEIFKRELFLAWILGNISEMVYTSSFGANRKLDCVVSAQLSKCTVCEMRMDEF